MPHSTTAYQAFRLLEKKTRLPSYSPLTASSGRFEFRAKLVSRYRLGVISQILDYILAGRVNWLGLGSAFLNMLRQKKKGG